MVRLIVSVILITSLIACGSAEKEQQASETHVNKAILELVQYVSDSVAECNTWLSKDYRVRNFFDDSDSLADYLIDRFDHDQFVSWFQSMDTTTQMDLRIYLDELAIVNVHQIDSIEGCASAINTIAFSHHGTEALVIYVDVLDNVVHTYSFLLEKPGGQWFVADTLRREEHPRRTFH